MDNIFRGKLVKLRGVEPADWEFFFRLDDLTTDFGRLTDEVWFPTSKEAARAWAEEQAKLKGKDDQFRSYG
jgi:hypothetical protein